jgi:hypothetical protein
MEALRQSVSRPAPGARLVSFKPAPCSGSTLAGCVKAAEFGS